jgi:hypothetical protein
MAGDGGSPQFIRMLIFLTSEFGCVTKKLCTPKIEQESMSICVCESQKNELLNGHYCGSQYFCTCKFSQPAESYVETCTNFYVFSVSTQMADRLGRLLDPYPTAPLFV